MEQVMYVYTKAHSQLVGALQGVEVLVELF